MSVELKQFYEFGPFRLDTSQCVLLLEGQPVPLPPKAYETLVCLVQHAGQVVGKDELMKSVWPDSFVEDGSLTFNIHLVRKALGEESGRHQYIQTVPRRGYRFISEVKISENGPPPLGTHAPSQMNSTPFQATAVPANRSSEANDISERSLLGSRGRGGHRGPPVQGLVANPELAQVEPEPVEDRPEPVQAEPERVQVKRDVFYGRRMKIGAMCVLAIGVVVSLTYFPARRPAERPERPAIRQMIAVLPFENLTGDPAEEFVSDGLTEEMITRLAVLNHEQLGVIARTSAMTYKGSGKSVDEIGQELGVGFILEGSVRRWGDRARISVQLIDARKQTHIWAKNYESDVRDILQMQSDVAQAVAREIRVALQPEGQVARTSQVDPEIYELCLRGRHEWNKRTRAGLTRAVEYFQQAVSGDPTYAPGYGGLAEAYAVMPYFSEISADEAASKARAAAERALQLDETLADAHAVLGLTDTIHLDLAGAEREYQRALQLNPNGATLHHWYSYVLWNTDRQQEALAEFERARQLDPLSLVINTDEAAMLCAAHQTDRAIGLLEAAIELDPNYADAHRTLAIACIQKGQVSRAISEAGRGWELEPNEGEQATLGYVYATGGKRGQARKVLAELARQPGISPVFLSFIYAGLGDNDQALACLERAYRERSFLLTTISPQPMLDPLRSDPRFQNLQHRISIMMQKQDSNKNESPF
jgi:TolB-like protein/DNA-binding winged helix-turn-helix (wHTH) protein/Tfp pilus assembly protein PilF